MRAPARSAALVVVVAATLLPACGNLEVVRQTSPNPFSATTPFSVEPLQPGVTDPGSAASAIARPDRIDPASIDLEQANRVFRAAIRNRGLEVNLSDGDIRPVGAMEIRAALIRLDATGGASGTPVTVIGPDVRTTIEMSVAIVDPHGRTLDELHLSATGPFYQSLESCGGRIATYLHGRGAARVPPLPPEPKSP